MNKEETILLAAKKMKLVRTENGYTQEKMAEVLGVSKKTLVQIEKERIKPSWTTIVAMCALFYESEVLQTTFGGNPLEIVTTIARNHVEYPKGKTLGGKVWWNELERKGKYCLQQNMISQHYRIIDEDNYRWYSTFDLGEALTKLDFLSRT